MSCLSEVYVTLPETTITLLSGRRTLVSPFFVQLCWGHLWAAAASSCSLCASGDGLQRAPGEEVFPTAVEGGCGSVLGSS